MKPEDLRLKLEEVGVEPEKIDEILVSVGDGSVDKFLKTARPPQTEEALDLQARWVGEKDWRKKSALAARLINLGIET